MTPDSDVPNDAREQLRLKLEVLARNFRWVWDLPTQRLFTRIASDGWEVGQRAPLTMLAALSSTDWHDLTTDSNFVAQTGVCYNDLMAYLGGSQPRIVPQVAYFSPEFGIAESLPQYSGGLGVLAGDHLKAASDLDVSLVGVGLFYRQGFFRQELQDGVGQIEHYHDLDPTLIGLEPVHGARTTVLMAGEAVAVQVWKAQVGRIQLFLLDTHVEGNSEAALHITNRLYGGDQEHRLRQELVLGVGGVRVLSAMGMTPHVFHLNEGHAGFLALERIRGHMISTGESFETTIDTVRRSLVFTTHTPVPAGIDRFSRGLMERYLNHWCLSVGVQLDDVMDLGHFPADGDQVFNMAAFCLRVSGRANGVSRLHGKVSREMFTSIWPDTPHFEVPITSITNGVHAPTWAAPEVQAVFQRVIGERWPHATAAEWAGIMSVSDEEMREIRLAARTRLVSFVRERLAARGVPNAESALNPHALTVGFARRFATYKRATLLLSDWDRLVALLNDPERPVQIVFAGKAHPADEPGKMLLREILEASADPALAGKFVFLDDYDIGVARALYHGCDVWLNNPIRPNEACGTSGEKAALSGALNLSVLDGWWDEMHDGANGWAIPSFMEFQDQTQRDAAEVAVIYDVFGGEIVPLFYEHGHPLSPRWLGRVRHTWASLAHRVSAARMLNDYRERLYDPAAQQQATFGGAPAYTHRMG